MQTCYNAMKTLRLILGDQLHASHSWYRKKSDDVVYCMFEMRQETDYVRHHIQKVLGFFAAMRNFAQALEKAGHRVIYYRISDPCNRQTLDQNLLQIIEQERIQHFEYQLPDESRLDEQLKDFCSKIPLSSAARDTEHFLSSRDTLQLFFEGRKAYTMEPFYRMMRKKHRILLDAAGRPEGGKWNYDSQNRAVYRDREKVPSPLLFEHNLAALYEEVSAAGIETIGEADATRFGWPLNRKESLQLLQYFCQNCLPLFGTYQDTMHHTERSLWHSRLSFSLNTKMLSPAEVIQAACACLYQAEHSAGLSQVEGFVRQILGWREYMRGTYWAQMPAFAQMNFFGHERPLPSWFWTGKTRMQCLQKVIRQSLEDAYAHHIQRLMISGNFALLAGIHPDETDAWYLGVYIDALEWVEITNTRGMSQFADGGITATKPYVASANYVHKMSNYCTQCPYKRERRYGAGACPLNSLYWHFHLRHQDKLRKNPRIGMVYVLLDKMPAEEKELIIQQAERYLGQIEEL